MTVTIIGAEGKMGSAIDALFTRGGTDTQPITHAHGDVPVEGDVVVLALPYAALAEIVAERREQLSGRVVVDISNPVDFDSFTLIDVEAGSSAQQLAAALPDASVVKAFNTNFAATLKDGTVGDDGPPTILVAADDDAAKVTVRRLIDASGARTLDAGPLARARALEAMAYLQIGLAMADEVAWTGGFRAIG